MKNLLLALMIMVAAPFANALELEIQPLSLKARASVFGLKVGVDGKKAIIFTGKAAQRVAAEAGQAFDASREMIVMTGEKVDELIEDSIQTGIAAGKTVVITSAEFTKKAINVAYTGIYTGKDYVFLAINKAQTKGKELVLLGLHHLKASFYLVNEIGVTLVKTPRLVIDTSLKLICEIPSYFGLGLIDCRK